jgi:hypothetical protein
MRARRAMSALAVIAALVVGQQVTSRLDLDEHGTDDPFLEPAALNQVAHLTYGDVQVTDVRPARHVVPQVSTELARIASGVFVLVSVKVTALREPTHFLAAYLVDDEGREFRPSAKAQCATNVKSYTGVPAYALFCFDVPANALAGLHLHIGRGSLVYSTLQGDGVADVDLGISEADETSWPRTEDAFLAEMTSREPLELRSVTLQEEES